MVRDAETGEPLAFANVILKGTSRGAATDSLGRFEFAGLAPRNLIAQVLYLGYKPTEQMLTLADSDTIEVQVALETNTVETLLAYDVDELVRATDRPGAEVTREPLGLGGNLDRQLAGRTDDQGLRVRLPLEREF